MVDLFSSWEAIKERVRVENEITVASYDIWINPLELYQVEPDKVYILVGQAGHLNYIRHKYTLPFQVVLSEVTGEPYDVEFISEEMLSSTDNSSSPDNQEK